MTLQQRRQERPKDTRTGSPIRTITARQLGRKGRDLLLVDTGGRCELCRAYLFEHHLTKSRGIFGQEAHVVAFRESGPRGDHPDRPGDINEIANVMLLCRDCHKEVDDNPGTYTREMLVREKEAHESRIRELTALGPQQSTYTVVVLSQIGGQVPAIPFAQIKEATAPRYPHSRRPFRIELSELSDRDVGYWETARAVIRRKVRDLTASGAELWTLNHISLFALAPVPVLMVFGAELGNKVPLDYYQHHRDSDDWRWKDQSSEGATYHNAVVREGVGEKIGLVLSLSGNVSLDDLPQEHGDATVYEIRCEKPSLQFLRSSSDVSSFAQAYATALADIRAKHRGVGTIDLFPAVPAPIAVACGRELMPKIHPAIRVYDYDQAQGGFNYSLTINKSTI